MEAPGRLGAAHPAFLHYISRPLYYFMKSHLQLVSTTGMSRQEWLTYRMTGIGASEVGAILGLDDYTSSLELFHYKIGNVPKVDTESLASFLGKQQEDLIAALWQHWDGSEEGMIANERAGVVVRKCRRINSFVRNPSFPWLYVSLDRVINKSESRDEGTLELKTIGGWEADKWEAGLPPKYVTQVQQQMSVCEFDWGEMALLEDGRRFFVLPFEPSKVIQERIIEETKNFWDKVQKGRELVAKKVQAQMSYNLRAVEELDAAISELEPPPDGSLAYDKYLSEKYKRPVKLERKGTMQELVLARRLQTMSADLKAMEEQHRAVMDELKASLGTYQVINFDSDGKVYWSATECGGRQFRNKLKP